MEESIASRLLDLWVREVISSEVATKEQYRELSFRIEGLKDEAHWLREEFTDFRAEVNQRFDNLQANIDQRFDNFQANTDQRFDSVNERFDSFQANIDQRFDSFQTNIEQHFDSFRSDIYQRFDSVNKHFDTMNERIRNSMKWIVGTIALFGTMITILMAIFKFF